MTFITDRDTALAHDHVFIAMMRRNSDPTVSELLRLQALLKCGQLMHVDEAAVRNIEGAQ